MYLFLEAELKKINKEVPNIHYGGCCVFAERLYKALIKLGKQPQICALTTTPDKLRRVIDERDEYGYFDLVHAFVKVDNYYVDNNGVYQSYKQIKHCHEKNQLLIELSLADIKYLNIDVSGWNRLFDRDNTLVIRKKLNQIINEIKLQNNLAVSI